MILALLFLQFVVPCMLVTAASISEPNLDVPSHSSDYYIPPVLASKDLSDEDYYSFLLPSYALMRRQPHVIFLNFMKALRYYFKFDETNSATLYDRLSFLFSKMVEVLPVGIVDLHSASIPISKLPCVGAVQEVSVECMRKISIPASEFSDRNFLYIKYESNTPLGKIVLYGQAMIIRDKPLLIISDVDDTIKQTNVLNAANLPRDALISPYVAIPGMPELYNDLRDRWPEAQFYYLSDAPFGLQPAIESFLDASKFPSGFVHLKRVFLRPSLAELRQLSSNSPHKKNAIENLMQVVPDAHLILFGDSGQKDPERYRNVFIRHQELYPDAPKPCIYIRLYKEVGSDRVLPKYMNSKERLLKDFEGVPSEQWMAFNDPERVSKVDFKNGCYAEGDRNEYALPDEPVEGEDSPDNSDPGTSKHTLPGIVSQSLKRVGAWVKSFAPPAKSIAKASN